VSPAEEYAQRLHDRRLRRARYDQIHIHIGNFRLLLFCLAALLAWGTFARHLLSPWWLTVPFGSFIVLADYHAKLLRKRTLAQRAANVYEIGLTRLDDKWAGNGQTGQQFIQPHHVYSSDLDLFGPGSLFELLSIARTRMGQETLASWLLTPAPVPEVLARQEAVTELRDRLDLREDLSVLGDDAAVGVHPKALVSWAESPNQLQTPGLTPLSRSLAAIAVAAAAVWGIWGLILPFGIVVAIEALLLRRFRAPVDRVLHGTEHTFANLDLLSGILARLEQESFASPRLKELKERLTSHHIPGSLAITRLRKLVDLSLSRDNLILRILNVPLMYSMQVAIAVEHWRAIHGPAVNGWLNTLGEIEALLSLASYSYEHPADPFPEFVAPPARFEATELGHPLIPFRRCVPNDTDIRDTTRVLLVSGSNMSGKSTLLRAVGLNVILAMAGSPVRAKHVRMSALQVGASIRINDSLQEGSSRFYAEITRLRQILDLAGRDFPLLFLLDELLQGTNSHDRRVGAEGIIRALVARGAIGMLSTHDLALTEISPALDGKLRNFHFEDDLSAGLIRFDYKLREGIVTKSNGLALMRSIGLEV
jgi:hypothetical protein